MIPSQWRMRGRLLNADRRRQQGLAARNNEPSPPPEKPRPNYPQIEKIESATRRRVTIETELTDANLFKCQSQEQSPLWQLPKELRDLIFEFATLPYDDPDNQYNPTDYFYRPENTARHIISTGFLLTCRRAWLEANHLPLANADNCFWMLGDRRRPKHLETIRHNEQDRLGTFIHSLTINNRADLHSMQIFSQLYWLEEGRLSPKLTQPLREAAVDPEVLTITITHTDWWYWEQNRRLQLKNQDWIQQLFEWNAGPRLREIRIELETIESRVHQLMPIVDGIKRRFAKFERRDWLDRGVVVELQDSPPDYTWSGPTNIDGGIHKHYEGMGQLDYRMVTLLWRVRRVEGQDGGNESEVKASQPDAANTSTNGVADQWMKEWREKGSLLRFASTIPQQ